MHLTDDVRKRLKGVRLLSLDLDGVLTDGGVYYLDSGIEARRFHIRDGMGIKMVQAAGIEVALITLSDAPHIQRRAERLGIAEFHPGARNKLDVMKGICARRGFGLEAVAHMADDVNDLNLLTAAGLAIAVSGAVPEVKRVAHIVTERDGGDCAVREICDLLLEQRPQ